MDILYKSPGFFYKKQQEIYDCKSRFVFTLAGNKVGKTASHCCWINEKCMLGNKGTEYAWIGPYIKTSEIAFNLLKKMVISTKLYKRLEESRSSNRFKFNNRKMRITYPNGNILNFFSGENVDAIYGFEISGAVCDEAARLKEEAFNALLSTMLATRGQIKLISNATIKNNWFYQKWLRATNEGIDETSAFKLTALDAIEAGIMSQKTFDFAKKNYSKAIFKRDFLAEVPSDDVSVFDYDSIYKNILDEDCSNSLNKVEYIGVDLGFTEGQKADWTVVIGLDKSCKVKFYKRFKAKGEELINKLKIYIGAKPSYIDYTGGGITVYELLKKNCPNLEPYTFTNTSKVLVIETLSHYIESNKIKYPDIKELIDELVGYEVSITKGGKTSYTNGRSVSHDDSVISLALAVLKFKESLDSNEGQYSYNSIEIDNPFSLCKDISYDEDLIYYKGNRNGAFQFFD